MGKPKENPSIAGEGLHVGIHNDIYRAFRATSYSDLKAWVEPDKKRINQRALNIGQALHAMVLEPETAGEDFWTAPKDVDRRTKDGREQYEAWCMEHPTQTVLLPRDREEIKVMFRAVKANPLAMKIIEAPGDNEVSGIKCMDGFETLSKCRLDIVRKGLLADIKTTAATNQAEFESSISLFNYDAQGAYYADIYKAVTSEFKPFFWICVSKRSLDCWVSQLEPWHYASGHRWWNDVLKLKERFDV